MYGLSLHVKQAEPNHILSSLVQQTLLPDYCSHVQLLIQSVDIESLVQKFHQELVQVNDESQVGL